MAIVPHLRKAKRQQCKASIVISGLSGSGKTGLALALAYGLTGDFNKVAVIDTENKSVDLYDGIKLHTDVIAKDFLVGDLTPEDGYLPSHYAEYRETALQQGCEAIVCDSLSHSWQYKGGILDLVEEKRSRSNNPNKWAGWGDPEVISEKSKIMDLVRHSKLHCINTLRVKKKQEVVTEDSKTFIKNLGEQQIIMPDFEYEPDLVLTTLKAGSSSGKAPLVFVEKSRYSPFEVGMEYEMTTQLIEQLRMFLEEGTSPEELLELQRKDYIEAIKVYLDTNENAKLIWPVLKENQGVSKTAKLTELELKTLKLLYTALIA